MHDLLLLRELGAIGDFSDQWSLLLGFPLDRRNRISPNCNAAPDIISSDITVGYTRINNVDGSLR